jgi:hypothetical protein
MIFLTLVFAFLSSISLLSAAEASISAETLITRGQTLSKNFATPTTVKSLLNLIKNDIPTTSPDAVSLINELGVSTQEACTKVLETPYIQAEQTKSITTWNKNYEENKSLYEDKEHVATLSELAAQLKEIEKTKNTAQELSSLLKIAIDRK